jgi:protocatechuate 3,4-dioxygenase beta subunit
MEKPMTTWLPITDRRGFLRASLAASVVAPGVASRAWAADLALTPSCGAEAHATPRQTEGPYFTPGSPERASLLEPGMKGTAMEVAGLVLSTRCEPVARALVDVWHADADGSYDNAGYRLRGHQFTDEHGRYRFETIVPGLYPGRTRHYHVKVQAPGGPLLTTQLYFAGESQNDRDFIYRPELLLAVSEDDGSKHGRFDFVVST